MKKTLLFSLFISLLYMTACNNSGGEEPTPDTDGEVGELITPDEDTPEDVAPTPPENGGEGEGEGEIETENEYLVNFQGDLSEVGALRTFLPKGHRIRDFAYGDLNKDDHKKDVVLIAYDPKAERDESGGEAKRPLIILTRGADGKLKKESRNDNVVLCFDCGGAMGDPYQSIAIKNGYFSIEHFGGSSTRWTEIITFRYHADKKNWYLHKKGGESFSAHEPEKVLESSVATTKDFGEVKFADYK